PAIDTTARRALGMFLGPAARRVGLATFPARRGQLLDRLGVDTVVDVGANIGQYAAQLRLYGYARTIHSYEPLGDAHRQLVGRAAVDRRWHAHHLGLGRSPGVATLHVAGNSQSSSLLPMLPRHIETAPDSAEIRQETVDVTTLADVLRDVGSKSCFV